MELAHGKAPGSKEMTGFPAKEGDRYGGPRRGPHYGAGIAVDPARHVDGDAKTLADGLDRGPRGAVDFPVESGAENRIDHQLGIRHRARRHRLDRAGPAPGIDRRVAPQPVAPAEQRDPHRPAAPLQQAGDHEPVAAIVAGAAQHRRRPARPADADPVGHRAPRRLHQLDPRRAAGDGERIRAGHLAYGQELGGHRPGQAAVSLRSRPAISPSTSSIVITSAYLWCRSNSAILWISSARSNTHSSTTVAW